MVKKKKVICCIGCMCLILRPAMIKWFLCFYIKPHWIKRGSTNFWVILSFIASWVHISDEIYTQISFFFYSFLSFILFICLSLRALGPLFPQLRVNVEPQICLCSWNPPRNTTQKLPSQDASVRYTKALVSGRESHTS